MLTCATSEAIASEWSSDFSLATGGRMSMLDLLSAVERMRADGLDALSVRLYQTWLANNESPLAYVVWFNVGVALAEACDYESAVAAYRRAISGRADFLPARFNLGTAFEKLGQPEAALAAWRDILELNSAVLDADPNTLKLTLNNLGRLLEIQRQYADAETVLHQSLALDTGQPDVIQHWLHLRQKQCAWPLLEGWPGSAPERALAAASSLSTLALTDDPVKQRAAARRFTDTRVTPAGKILAERSLYGHAKLRIAYLSGDFCLHPVALLMVELFELHDREQFEIFGYCWSPEDGSAIRQRVISGMDHFIRIAELGDEAAATRIRADEIDILIDLQGLTAGARPNLIAFRPAPIQIAYLGFPGTTGHPEIDYQIVDRYVFQAEHAAAYSEVPLFLPHCFQPSDRQREIASPPTRAECLLPESGFVFCCFNNNYKITPELFSVWMRILARVPGSVLWLLADNPWSRANLSRAAERDEVDPARLIFAERVAPPIYLSRYRLADLFLDTTPFNAGTTANDALALGLPVLTLSGRAFASRMAGSLLRAMGLDELLALDLDDYESRAVALATAPQRLSRLRRELDESREHGPVFDMPRFARDLEALYANVAARHQVSASAHVRRRFLHVGCGGQRQEDTLPIFNDGNWDEIRLDIDPAAQPDFLGSMTDLSALAEASVDAIYSSHNIEHLYPHEVSIALREFLRVLRADGFMVVTCPDLQSVCSLVAQNRLTETIYVSPAGPIAPLDILYGHRKAIEQGQTGMAHRGGFTRDSLVAALQCAGFGTVSAICRAEHFDLWAFAAKGVWRSDDWSTLMGVVA